MSNEFELNAMLRTDLGKGASRRLRRLADQVPAIIYGAGKDPVSITLAHKDIMKAVENEAFFSHVISLNVEKKKEKVILKDMQRHPAKDKILHADFLRIDAKHVLHIKVPLHFINEDKCLGVKAGGVVSHQLNEIEVACLPKDLPEFIEVDTAELEIGDIIHISDIELPEGVTSIDLSHGADHNLTIASVLARKGGGDEDEEETAAKTDDDEAADEESTE